jgi:Brp/Blh family beta-carotene 15,15'-monooxygenase
MSKIQIQGLVFSVIAISIGLVSTLLAPTGSTLCLLILAALIFFLGVPHGALDPVFAQKLLHLKNWKDWSTFVITYIALSAVVVCIWWQLPLVFMAGFLLLSVMHFSRDFNDRVPKITRLLYGGSMIVLPTLFHLEEMQLLFSLILNEEVGLQITNFLNVLVWPWLVASLISIYLEFVKEWLVGLEILAVALLSTLASPLVAFTIYFCGMHSLRHILRTSAYANMPFIKLGLISLAPMMGVVFIIVLAWLYLPELPDYELLLRFVFVGLAALTVPHMVLIDRIRYQF